MTVSAIEVLFEDEHLVAAFKPLGLPVHVTHDPTRPHVQGLLEKQLGRSLVLFHRLDVDTTGVLLFGKDPAVNGAISDAFRERQIEKTYWAVVDGRWPDTISEVKTYIDKVAGGAWKNVPKGGMFAHSLFRTLSTNGAKSWIEVKPQTGRTHQIRLHCQHAHHPILGDRLYGKPDSRGVPIALHARSLGFTHPITKKKILVEAPLPPHWKEHWLKGLDAASEGK